MEAAFDTSAAYHAVTDAEMEKSEQLPPMPQQAARSPEATETLTPSAS